MALLGSEDINVFLDINTSIRKELLDDFRDGRLKKQLPLGLRNMLQAASYLTTSFSINVCPNNKLVFSSIRLLQEREKKSTSNYHCSHLHDRRVDSFYAFSFKLHLYMSYSYNLLGFSSLRPNCTAGLFRKTAGLT